MKDILKSKCSLEAKFLVLTIYKNICINLGICYTAIHLLL